MMRDFAIRSCNAAVMKEEAKYRAISVGAAELFREKPEKQHLYNIYILFFVCVDKLNRFLL
jgi:hypothetical protein